MSHSNRGKPLDERLVENIRKLRDNGMSLREIQRETGIAKSTIEKHTARELTPDLERKARQLRTQGESIQGISQMMGISEPKLKPLLADLGDVFSQSEVPLPSSGPEELEDRFGNVKSSQIRGKTLAKELDYEEYVDDFDDESDPTAVLGDALDNEADELGILDNASNEYNFQSPT